MTKLFYVLVVAIVLFFGLTFAYMNGQTVEIRYFSFVRQTNLVLLLLSALVLGVMLGYVVSLFASFKVRRESTRLKRELSRLQSSEYTD